jgi:putative FmdB family regulatory protein
VPTYEYKCPECNRTRVVHHNITHEPQVLCLVCHKTMNKGFGGGSAIHFKGSGFYETDYKGR